MAGCAMVAPGAERCKPGVRQARCTSSNALVGHQVITRVACVTHEFLEQWFCLYFSWSLTCAWREQFLEASRRAVHPYGTGCRCWWHAISLQTARGSCLCSHIVASARFSDVVSLRCAYSHNPQPARAAAETHAVPVLLPYPGVIGLERSLRSVARVASWVRVRHRVRVTRSQHYQRVESCHEGSVCNVM